MGVLADNLRMLLVERLIDTAELARRTRIPVEDVERFVAGTARPCPRQQARLAQALGVTTSDLHHDGLGEESRSSARGNGRVTGTERPSVRRNSATGLWTDRDTSSGRFLDVKRSGGTFAGVRRER